MELQGEDKIDQDLPRNKFAIIVCVIVAIMQIIAWVNGYDGQVFTFTSMTITGIAGAIIGFSYGKKT